MSTFSLIRDPWLPCVLEDGSSVELSLAEVFDGSRSIARLRGDSPPQTYSLLRLLLVVFWRSHLHDEDLANVRDPDRYSEWWEHHWHSISTDFRDEAVLDYLERYAVRFELFGDTPFMQVANLETSSGNHSDVRRLLPETESDYFTMRAGTGQDALTFGEAARWLVAMHAYDYSGIKSGAIGDPRVKGGKGYPIGTGWSGMTGGVILHGRSLSETLLLNTVPSEVVGEAAESDRPVWERDPDSAAERASTAPTGPCDLLTWQSRRVRLFASDDRVTKVLISNGDRIPDAGANVFGDPMTPYRYSANKSKKGRTIFYPRQHDAERTLWRSLGPLLALGGVVTELKRGEEPPKPPRTVAHLAELRESETLAEDTVVDVELVGTVYGAQSSSVANVVTAQLGLPLALLSTRDPRLARLAITAASSAQDAAIALGQFAGQLQQAAGGDYEFSPSATNNVLDALEDEFTAWLRGLRREIADRHLVAWFADVRRRVIAEAELLTTGAGPRALVGRLTSNGDSEQYVSAGSAHQTLLRKLSTILPIDKETPDGR